VLVRDLKFTRLRSLWRGVLDGFTEDLILVENVNAVVSVKGETS
jgi:hypothetical protein